MKKLLTGLFYSSKKRVMTKDNDMGMFRDSLNALVKNKDSMSDDEIDAKVEELKAMTDNLPDDDGKAKLSRFLEDFKAVKEQNAEVAKEAAKQVADEFERLDTAAMQDVPGAGDVEEEVPAEEEVPTEEPVEETEEVVEETIAPEEEVTEEAEDADPNAEYSLEEIYQFIKKRMAEDSAEDLPEEDEVEEEEEEVIEDEEVEEEDDECVQDHAPRISVTVNDHASKGSLAALFDLAKGRK